MSTSDKAVPSTSSQGSGKKPSISSSDLDYEDESGIEYELLKECADEPSQEGNISSVQTYEHKKSTSTKEQDTRKVISIDEYRSRKVEEKQIQDMQEAIANLICTAGYQSLLKEVRGSFSNPVESLHEMTRLIRLNSEPCNFEESGLQDMDDRVNEADLVQEHRGGNPEEEKQQDGEVMENLLPVEERLVKKKGNPDAGEGDGGMQLVDEGVDGLETVGKKADKNPEVDVDGAAHMEEELIVKLKRVEEKGENVKRRTKRTSKSTEKDWGKSENRKHGTKQNKGSEKRKRGMKHSESSEKTMHGESEKKERCREKQDERSEILRPVKKVDSDSGDGQGLVIREILGLVDGKGTEENQNVEDADVTLDLVDGEGAENIPDETQKEVVTGVMLGPVDGAKEIWEDHGKRNQDEEDADVTLDLVDGEGAENLPDENQKEVVTGVKRVLWMEWKRYGRIMGRGTRMKRMERPRWWKEARRPQLQITGKT